MDKKNLLTYQGLQKLESELQDLKVVKRKEIAQKIKEAREQIYQRMRSMMLQKMSSVISRLVSRKLRKF